MISRFVFFVFTLFVAVVRLFAVEDAYHSALRSFLSQKYAITGGDWVLGETEKETFNKAQPTGLSKKVSTYTPGGASDPIQFTQLMELKVAKEQPNSWDNALRFLSSTSVKNGDALLLVIWMKGIEATTGYGNVEHIFEMTDDPWTKSLAQQGDLAAEWQQWILPFQAGGDYAASKSRYQINCGHMAGTFQIGGLAVLNFGKKYKKSDLPESEFHLQYQGREEGAQWRIDALARIEQIRKGDLQVEVINRKGEAIKNAAVTVTMKQNQFGFGTAVAGHRWFGRSQDDLTYLEKLEDLTGDGRTFNIAVIENDLKWGNWEWTDGNPVGKAGVVQVVDWLKSHDYRVRGHNLVWPAWTYLPADLQTHKNDVAYLRDRIYNHIFEEAGYPGLKGVLDHWDVINEMSHCLDLAASFGTEDIYTDWLNWAHEADPDARLYINEYSIVASGGKDTASQAKYKEIIQRLIDQGAPLDGLGVQCHFGTYLTPPERVLQVFDEFGVYGKEISITEYDAVGAKESIAADYMRDILICAFSHPAVANFLMWGFWDGSHWFQDAPIFRQDWSLKPSGEVFIDYVFNKWWTNDSGLTGREGRFATRAYYGDYDISVDFRGVKADRLIHFTKENNGVIQIQLETDFSSVVLPVIMPQEIELLGNYPNPFNAFTTLRYGLPTKQHVTADVYDVQGRWIQSLLDSQQSTGWHEVQFNATNLATGIYYCRFSAGTYEKNVKMVLVK
jgi:endo-1,4-beta-xylanase